MAQEISSGKYERPRHVEFLSRTIAEEVAAGGARIIIMTPPRHGKSELCSKGVPTWVLSIWPHWRVVLATYEKDFSTEWGRKVKRTIDEHGSKLGVRLAEDSRAADRWETTAGGGMFCCGIGGALIGRGFDVGIIDDPVKNAEEAQSEAVRERNIDWYRTTFSTRKEPGASIIVIMQRFDESDLVGFLLDEMAKGGERWDVYRLPSLAEEDDVLGREPGEALWPERKSREELEAQRSVSGAYWWATQWQQRPAPAEGGAFRRGWFKVVSEVPADVSPYCVRLRSWDFAGTKEKGGGRGPDWTVGARIAYHAQSGRLWIEHLVRVRETPGSVRALVLQMAHQDGDEVSILLQQDPGQAGKDQIESYVRDLIGYRVVVARPTGDKEKRAEPFSSQCEHGNVHLVRGAWVNEFVDEHVVFPNGAYDDQVDAASMGVNVIARLRRRFTSGAVTRDPERESQSRSWLDGYAPDGGVARGGARQAPSERVIVRSENEVLSEW